MGVKKAPLPNIVQKYPTLMKLGTVIAYVTKIKKYTNQVTQSWSSADTTSFYRKSAIFVTSRNTDVDCILMHNL